MPGHVTVVIPTCNRPERLNAALRSLHDQSYDDFDVCVINDGDSKAEVEEVVAQHADLYIRMLANAGAKGANGARNTGIHCARGEFVAFLDDDDLWLPDKLRRQVERLSSLTEDWGGVYCAYTVVEKEGRVSFSNLPEGDFKDRLLTGRCSVGASSTLMFRTQAIRAAGMWDESLRRKQDVELMVRFMRDFKVACVQEVLVEINGHNDPSGAVLEAVYADYIPRVHADLQDLSRSQRNWFNLKVSREFAFAYARDRDVPNALRHMWRAFQAKPCNVVRHLEMVVSAVLFTVGLGTFMTHVKRRLKRTRYQSANYEDA